MKWLQLAILGVALAGQARGEDIVDVLRRSQQQRLDAMPRAPSNDRAMVVRSSFEKLCQALKPEMEVDLVVIAGATTAETLHGHIIVANESLADLPEGERIFILAHEIGHVVSDHWHQMGGLYRRWIPGEVTPSQTDPVAGSLGREASGLAHRQEFEADAFALQALRRLGFAPEVAVSAFMRQGMQQDTATHPGTRKRLAALRAAMADVTASQ
jgi:Zn-dependent protease with chaperone function